MKRLAILMLCLLPLPALAQSNTPKDHAAIRAVVEQFRVAIIHKDKSRFIALFAHPPITWRTVFGDAMLKKMRKRNPGVHKAPFNPRHNYRQFIDFVNAHQGPIEETFRNIRIDSDGDVASVNFDYAFHMDKHETNRGQESWQLLRTDKGWRIVSVIWSTNPPPAR